MPGRSGPTLWSLQNRGSPRPRSRAKRGGRAPEAPKGGRRVPRRGDTTRPLDAKPAGGIRHFPRKTSRKTRPARPAGGGTNAFCLPSMGEPAPPGSRNCPFPARAGEILCITTIQPSRATPVETFVPRPARVPRNHFPRCNPRAILELRDNRLPLHKHPVSTYPLPLTPAFPRSSPFREISAIPRPCLKKQGRRGWGIPLGRVLPPRRASLSCFRSRKLFSACENCFHLVGKGIPRAGAHNKQL